MWLEGLDCVSQEDIQDTRVWSNFDNTVLMEVINCF